MVPPQAATRLVAREMPAGSGSGIGVIIPGERHLRPDRINPGARCGGLVVFTGIGLAQRRKSRRIEIDDRGHALEDDYPVATFDMHDQARVRGEVAPPARLFIIAVEIKGPAHPGAPDRGRVWRAIRARGAEPVNTGADQPRIYRAPLKHARLAGSDLVARYIGAAPARRPFGCWVFHHNDQLLPCQSAGTTANSSDPRPLTPAPSPR